MQLPDYFYDSYFGNTALDYCWVLGLLLAGLIFQRFITKIISNLIFKLINRKNETITKDDFYKLVHAPLAWFIYLIIIYSATSHIKYPESWDLAPVNEFGLRMIVHRIYLLFLFGSFSWIVLRIIDFIALILEKGASKTETKQDDQVVAFGKEIAKIIVVILTVFLILGNIFNVNISSLIAGLGIGGLALALAAKESLENLLASFTIFFDKPFVVGDTVKVSGQIGTVEKVGFRSTRLRTLEKSFLTLPNRKMVDAELDNLTLRTFRKVSQTIGILYGTKQDAIKAIVNDIQTFLDEHPHTNQDGRVRLSDFGASSLDIMVVYFIDTMDWTIYLDVKQEINYEIISIVEKHGSDFAFPTHTVHLEK